MPVPHEQPYRGRRFYKFGPELSGLERPRQWVSLTVAVIVVLVVLFVVAFLAFG